mmetsp:Transcript_23840/g.66126  ORF Transcript_23840/g.66126 Transcript_23840/m.66126 type:complete len:288 (-) Transcript_23840:204-1067(-)
MGSQHHRRRPQAQAAPHRHRGAAAAQPSAVRPRPSNPGGRRGGHQDPAGPWAHCCRCRLWLAILRRPGRGLLPAAATARGRGCAWQPCKPAADVLRLQAALCRGWPPRQARDVGNRYPSSSSVSDSLRSPSAPASLSASARLCGRGYAGPRRPSARRPQAGVPVLTGRRPQPLCPASHEAGLLFPYQCCGCPPHQAGRQGCEEPRGAAGLHPPPVCRIDLLTARGACRRAAPPCVGCVTLPSSRPIPPPYYRVRPAALASGVCCRQGLPPKSPPPLLSNLSRRVFTG